MKFINKYLKIEGTKNELQSNQIEKCNTEFITKEKEQIESDILYKIKETETFILIEQQSKVDYFMAKRILYYCVEIIRETEKEENIDKIVPTVYPIVLYTGKTRWTAKTELSELQENIDGIEKALYVSYNLVDINNYTKEELIKERSSIAKAMLMEKIKNKEELIDVLESIVKEDLTKQEKKFMLDILTNIVEEEIGKEKAGELKEKIEKKEVNNMVTENLRNIFRMNYNEGVEFGIQKGIQNGIQTATRNFVIQMIKNKMSDKTIKKITKINDEQLKEIKENMKC